MIFFGFLFQLPTPSETSNGHQATIKFCAKGILLQAYLKSETKSNQAFLWGQILFTSFDCWEVLFEITFLVFILFFLTVNVEFFNNGNIWFLSLNDFLKMVYNSFSKAFLIEIYGVESQWFPPKHTLLLKCTETPF